jgi:hypothetical protein
LTRYQVSGRILIDTFGYQKHHLGLKRRDGKDQESKNAKLLREAVTAEEQAAIALGIPGYPHHSLIPVVDANENNPETAGSSTIKDDDLYIKRLSDGDQKKNKDEMLARKDDLIYISPMLVGYALKNKLWCKWAP